LIIKSKTGEEWRCIFPATAMSAWDFFEPSELAAIQERYRLRQRGEQVPSYYETSVLHKKGKYIPVETSLSNMTYQGKIATVVYFQEKGNGGFSGLMIAMASATLAEGGEKLYDETYLIVSI
jgi:hypothetical protein